jgi:methionyl-tRNA formyltransferase
VTYGELHDRLARRGAEMTVEALRRYADGTLERRPQAEIARELGVSDAEIIHTATRPLRKEDLLVDWSQPAPAIVNLVRSLAPQPLARTTDARGETLKLAVVHAEPRPALLAGSAQAVFEPRAGRLVLAPARPSATGGAAVAVSGEWVVLDEVVPAGKGAMSGDRYAQMLRDQMQRRTQTAERVITVGEKA